ncbi:MAG: hypothetical protein IT198_08920 [Acidimicrobiia bacterium]|nr:hypothetical protein [Acidimicrobiia bacterium]
MGAVLGAISGATVLLAVTWSASPAPRAGTATTQRTLLVAGTIAVALGRELDAAWLTGVGAAAVLAALCVLAAILLQVRAGGVTRRFVPAIDGYVAALGFGAAGIVIGGILALHGPVPAWDLRAAHLTVNLYGLTGLVIAATLPYFAATQARTKMSPLATGGRLHATSAWLATATLVAALGAALDLRDVAAGGLVAYALGIGATVLLLPRLDRRSLAWAGPRILQLFFGIAWWIAMTGALAVVTRATEGSTTPVLLALVVGGYAQILTASLAYLGPVLRGGGHASLTAAFGLTRAWPSLVAANVAAVAALVQQRELMAVALAVWVADAAVRGVRLVFERRQPVP